MLARYYSSSLGRFMAVDPGDDSALEDPQSWNKYSYVGSNPLNSTDPDGRFKIYGTYSHQNATRAGVPAKGGTVRQKDVVRGNRAAEKHGGGKGRPNHLNGNRESAPVGTGADTRIQHGTEALGTAIQQGAAGETRAAGRTLGDANHSFEDAMGHGNVSRDEHYSEANGGRLGGIDRSDAPGIDIRHDAAARLDAEVYTIFSDAVSAINNGGDAACVIESAQRAAVDAATRIYNETSAALSSLGERPQGY